MIVGQREPVAAHQEAGTDRRLLASGRDQGSNLEQPRTRGLVNGLRCCGQRRRCTDRGIERLRDGGAGEHSGQPQQPNAESQGPAFQDGRRDGAVSFTERNAFGYEAANLKIRRTSTSSVSTNPIPARTPTRTTW